MSGRTLGPTDFSRPRPVGLPGNLRRSLTAGFLTGLLASVPALSQQTSGSVGSLLFPGLPAAAPPRPSGPEGNALASPNPSLAAPAVTSPPAKASVGDSSIVEPPSGGPVGPDSPARARPLFSATRRPPPVPVILAVQPPPLVVTTPRPAPELRLIGVVYRPERTVAFLLRTGSDRTVAVRVGDRVEDWIVGAIETKRIMLRDGAREQTYALFAGSPAPGRLRASAVGPAGQSSLPQPRLRP